MRRIPLAIALVSLIFLAGCSKQLVIGVVLPETGESSEYGASIKTGVKLAFDEAMTAKTAPEGLQVIYRDSGSDPARAVSEQEALYDEGALVVIGGATTEEAKAMVAVADKRERILISPSASAPDLARQSVYFFRVYPSDDFEGVTASDILYQTRGVRQVLILQQDNAYTRGLLTVFMGAYKSAGGEIIGTVRIGDPGWEKEARDLLAAHQPRGVYVCGYGDTILEGLRFLRGVGYGKDGETICTTSAINTAQFLQQAGDLAEGVFFPLAGFDSTSKKEPVATFVRRYYDVYQLTPDVYAAHGYDAALVALEGVRNLKTHSAGEIQIKLKGLGEMQGVTGFLAFDDYGNIKHYPKAHFIRDGKVEDFNAYIESEKDRLRKEWQRMVLEGGR